GVNTQKNYDSSGQAVDTSNRPPVFFRDKFDPTDPKPVWRIGFKDYDPNDPKDKNLKPDYVASMYAKAKANPNRYEITPDGQIIDWGTRGAPSGGSSGSNPAASTGNATQPMTPPATGPR